MKHIPKNNVILKTQDTSQTRRNYNETVILLFILLCFYYVFTSVCLFVCRQNISKSSALLFMKGWVG